MAKVLVVLTPDDRTDEEEILEQIELMVQNPRDDETAFYLAQARFMLATSNLEYIDEDLLRKAKKTFKKLEYQGMVADCDEMLKLALEHRKSKIPPELRTKSKAATPPPLPKTEAPKTEPFHPVGMWDVEIHALIRSTMYLNVLPNGTLAGNQMFMPFNGGWSFQNNYLYIQGYMNGFPFEFAVQIQYEQDGQYVGMGTDGNRYVFKRHHAVAQSRGMR